jgi:hypothetical protein
VRGLAIAASLAAVAIVAMVAVPRFIAGRDSSLEEHARAYLDAIYQGETVCQARFGRWGTLDELLEKGYVRRADVDEYAIAVEVAPDGRDYAATATPVLRPAELRSFFIDASGVARWATGAPADATSAPIGEAPPGSS